MRLCVECRKTPASGIWKITSERQPTKGLYLCAQCGLRDYQYTRSASDSTLRVDLVRSFTTKYVSARSEPQADVPEKHWAEHQLKPELRARGMTVTQFVANVRRNALGKSEVSSTILNGYKR